MFFLPHDQIDTLLSVLRKNGYTCIGPQVKNSAIVYDELTNSAQLPWGIQELQSPGMYRLQTSNQKRAFSWANGPQAIKPILFKPTESLWHVERDESGKLVFKEKAPNIKPIALFGARSCDIAGMLVQDKVFIQGEYIDKTYQQQRDKLFIIAVNCGYSSDNCFCVSTQTGPKAKSGFDISLSEIENGFVVDFATEAGNHIKNDLKCENATIEQISEAEANINQAASTQKKRMPKNNSRELRNILLENLDHERWNEVASRCLSCGNCTSVCPTCFCQHETSSPNVDNQTSTHAREWDSCFSAGHSTVNHKVLRDDTEKRYKQWLTHKLGTWWDQFDTSGCVGCGRCVTWCPVGIDLTEEMAAIAGDSNRVSEKGGK